MAELKTTLAEEEARLASREVDVEQQVIVAVRKWENVDATYAETLLAATNGIEDDTTVDNPKVDGQTYSGTWRVNYTKGEGENDRSVTIFQTMRQGPAADGILTLTVVTQINKFVTETSVYKWGMTQAQLLVFEGDYDGQADGYTHSITPTRRGPNNYDAVGVTRTAEKQEWDGSFTSYPSTVTVKRGVNVTSDEFNTAVNSAALAINCDASVTKVLNTAGLFDYSITKRPRVSGGSSGRASYTNYNNTAAWQEQQYVTIRGQMWTRTLKGLKIVAGNTDPGAVLSALTGCDYKPKFWANSDGSFFHGEGVDLNNGSSTTTWILDESGMT